MRTIITLAIIAAISSSTTQREAWAAEPTPKEEPPKAGAIYTCRMHPEVVAPKPGKCAKCGMKLVAKTSGPKPDKAM